MERERTPASSLSEPFLELLKGVTAKRPKIVIDHILQYGYVTTRDLRDLCGYNHPPRAARDVREQGIPLETFRVSDADGRSIGAYRFGNPEDVRARRLGGRRTWPKGLKDDLVVAQNSRCSVCLVFYESRELRIDHAIPYEVMGEPSDMSELSNFMLLCGSCNRAKSWSCEHCINWTDEKNTDLCRTCYWASPAAYSHISLRLIRRIDIVWGDTEIPEYERLVALSRRANQEVPDFVKSVIREYDA